MPPLVGPCQRGAYAYARARTQARANTRGLSIAIGATVYDETGLLGNAIDAQDRASHLDVTVADKELEKEREEA